MGTAVPTDTFSWLHLTDFHYGLKQQGHLWPTLREPFLESLAALSEKCGPWNAVLFTGDLVQSGKSEEFSRMQAEVLEPLWEKLKELGSGDAVLLAVPGNHDLFRPNPAEDDAAVDALLDKDGFKRIEEKFWDQPAGSYRRVVNNAFAAYREWWSKAPRRADSIHDGILPGDFSTTLSCGERKIGILGLNTAFLQLAGGDYKERLIWDARQIHAVCDGQVDVWTRQHDVCLLLTHQGQDWLTPAARKHGESEIAPAGRFAVQLYGHQHEHDIKYVRQGGSTKAMRFCQGCSVFGMEKFGEPPKTQRSHGYSAGRIEFGNGQTVLRLWPRVATNETGPWRFVPDHHHAELIADEGTAPDLISARPGASRRLERTREEPAASTVSLTSVLNDAKVPHSTLPSRRVFFGRILDLEKISKYLLPEDRSWGVVLDGPGGVGKTSLALEAAHRAPAEHFPLKLWISAKNRELRPEGERELTDHRVDDYHALLDELGRALGRDDIPRAIPEDRPALIRHALAHHRALLVLDNVEAFNTKEQQRLFELLANLPSACRAIVTSRRRLDSAAHVIRLDKLERDAADALLAELGQRWEPLARLTAPNRDQLYAETGGNPLLLTWTAGQLGRTTGRCRTIAEAVERLQEAHRLQSNDPLKNDPLDFVFGDLLETFTPDETAVLSCLVHFTQPAQLEWLLPMTTLSQKAVETALDGLRDRSLLVEDEVAGTWALPPLAARFLRRARPEAVGSSGRRLADWAYALAIENGYKQYDRYPTLDAAWPQLAAALPVLIAGANHRLQTVCGALAEFLDYSGRWDDRLDLGREAESKALLARDFYRAGGRAYWVGWCHLLRGQHVEVLASADRAAAHWERARADTRQRAQAIRLRGLGHKLAKDYPAAIAALREALDLHYSRSAKSRDVAIMRNSLGQVLRVSGNFDEAETHFREALAIAAALEDRSGVAAATLNLAELALDREQWPESERLARQALKMAEGIFRKAHIASSCQFLAKSLARQNRGGEGRGYAERAVALFTELRSPKLGEAHAALAECQG